MPSSMRLQRQQRLPETATLHSGAGMSPALVYSVLDCSSGGKTPGSGRHVDPPPTHVPPPRDGKRSDLSRRRALSSR